MRRPILTALGIVMAAAIPATALMIEVPLSELAERADAVVQGKVLSVRSAWSDDGRTIFTEVVVEPDGRLKGATPNRVLIRVEGGKVGEITIRVEHAPRFQTGEEVLLFLAPPQGDIRTVLDWEQGKFTMTSDAVIDFRGRVEPRPRFLRDLEQLVLAEPE